MLSDGNISLYKNRKGLFSGEGIYSMIMDTYSINYLKLLYDTFKIRIS